MKKSFMIIRIVTCKGSSILNINSFTPSLKGAN